MRRIVWALTVFVLAAGMPVAGASHPTQMCLDIGADQAYPTTGDVRLNPLTAFPGATDAGHPPEHEGCVTGQVISDADWGGTNVDFEMTGDSDPDSSDSPNTPDLTCTVPAASDRCEVHPPGTGGDTQTIRAWIDSDLNDATVEADLAEGYDETTSPGDSPEPDITDVTEWHWLHGDFPYEVTMNIKFRRSSGTFSGKVQSDHASCRNERPVKLIKIVGGERRTKGTTTSTTDGTWRVLGFRRAAGRFYAVAPRFSVVEEDTDTYVECLRGKSETLRV